MSNPFLAIAADMPLVALKGKRNGYIMLAPAQEITHYGELPTQLFQAAQAWATLLETSGSPRAYWITLSEVTRHLHIHLFPRWETDNLKGVELFETRDTQPQPDWEPALLNQLEQWATQYQVTIGNPGP